MLAVSAALGAASMPGRCLAQQRVQCSAQHTAAAAAAAAPGRRHRRSLRHVAAAAAAGPDSGSASAVELQLLAFSEAVPQVVSSPEGLAAMPSTSGVYAVYNAEGVLHYIGISRKVGGVLGLNFSPVLCFVHPASLPVSNFSAMPAWQEGPPPPPPPPTHPHTPLTRRSR